MPKDAPHHSAGSTDAISDEMARSLTARMAAGDRDAYAQLFRLRCAFVEQAAARALGVRRDLALDAAQDAWMRVARAPVRCPSAAALAAWLRRVAASAAVDLLRNELARRLREERVARSRAEAGDFLEQAALLEHARRELDALRSLAHEDRALLELRIRMEGAIAPIAAALGLGMPALDSRLRRASERARRALQGVAR